MERLLMTIETGWDDISGDPRTWLQNELRWLQLVLFPPLVWRN